MLLTARLGSASSVALPHRLVPAVANRGHSVVTDRALRRPASAKADPSMPQLIIRCGTTANQAESQPPPKRCSPPSSWSSALPRITIPRGVHGSVLARSSTTNAIFGFARARPTGALRRPARALGLHQTSLRDPDQQIAERVRVQHVGVVDNCEGHRSVQPQFLAEPRQVVCSTAARQVVPRLRRAGGPLRLWPLPAAEPSNQSSAKARFVMVCERPLRPELAALPSHLSAIPDQI